jgi:hypothetical protein
MNPPAKTVTIRIAEHNGEPMIDTAAMSLLFGIDEATIAAHWDTMTGDMLTLPAEWVRNGKRRAKEASANAGVNDVVAMLSYWAMKDLGATLWIVRE